MAKQQYRKIATSLYDIAFDAEYCDCFHELFPNDSSQRLSGEASTEKKKNNKKSRKTEKSTNLQKKREKNRNPVVWNLLNY